MTDRQPSEESGPGISPSLCAVCPSGSMEHAMEPHDYLTTSARGRLARHNVRAAQQAETVHIEPVSVRAGFSIPPLPPQKTGHL